MRARVDPFANMRLVVPLLLLLAPIPSSAWTLGAHSHLGPRIPKAARQLAVVPTMAEHAHRAARPPQPLTSRGNDVLTPVIQRMRSAVLSTLFALTIALGGGQAAHAAVYPPQPSAPTVVRANRANSPSARVPARPSVLEESHVFDDANLLDQKGRAALNSQIRSAEASTNSEILLVTLKTIGKRDQQSYATEMFNRWHVGRSDDNRGVLVLFVADGGANGRGRIEVSVWKGFNSQVSHSWTSDMLETSVLPRLRMRDFETGFARCISRLAPRLTMTALQSSKTLLTVQTYGTLGSLFAACLAITDRNSRKCDNCGAICERGRCTPWRTIKEATDKVSGLSQREVACHKCGSTSVKSSTIRKYDGVDRHGRYYYNSDSSDGGGSDGGGGGGGDC